MFCIDFQLNKAFLSDLLTEERTRRVLELPAEARDWRVVLSEAHLRESHLWSHVEHIQRGIPIPPLMFSLQGLLLHRAIHVLYGEHYLNPLSADELQLAEEEKKGFKIPSSK